MKERLLPIIKESLLKIAPISDERLTTLFDLLDVINVSTKTVLTRQGDAANRIFFVCHGLLKTYFIDQSGREITKGFISEGGLAAPYISMLTKEASNMSIIALEGSTLLSITDKNLSLLYDTHTDWHVFGRKCAESILIEKAQREYQMMVLDTETRYHTFLREYADIASRVPQYEIASYLGVTPVALSKIRAKIRDRRRHTITESVLRIAR